MVFIFEKQLSTIDYFVHLQCFKRGFSRINEKSILFKLTNN